MRASVDFLIERITVQGIGRDVGHGLGHLKIVIAQLAHMVEFVGKKRKSILAGSGVYRDPASRSACCA
jgi:hypothetical protein